MKEVNLIARDINAEVAAQNEKLVKVDREMGNTADNTFGAARELREAEIKQKRSYKTIASVLLFAVIVLTITIVSF